MKNMKQKKGLGRGLGALLKNPLEATDRLQNVMVDDVQPGRYQPRTLMDQSALDELAQSIRQQGVIQPILVRVLDKERYEIIAGERRWRAAKLAGLTEIPAVVRDIPDEHTAVVALIENIQREDLNPLEEAAGLQRLIQEFGMTHESAAKAVGKSRSNVSNLLRLLSLAEPVRELVLQGQLDMGHARALLTLEPKRQIELAKLVALKALSVRETERLAQLPTALASPVARTISPELSQQENILSQRLGAKVSIRSTKKGGGRVTIEYADMAYLVKLLAKF
jgi:ParB family chromosome partitioning protein